MAPIAVGSTKCSRPATTFLSCCIASSTAATLISPIDFLRVPLSALIGWLLYHEQIDVYTALGAALILAGNLLNLQTRPARDTEAVAP